jgi:hypothetical protein
LLAGLAGIIHPFQFRWSQYPADEGAAGLSGKNSGGNNHRKH